MSTQLTRQQTAVAMQFHWDSIPSRQQESWAANVRQLINSGDFSVVTLARHYGVHDHVVTSWRVMGTWLAIGLPDAALDVSMDLEDHSVWLRQNAYPLHDSVCPCSSGKLGVILIS